MRKQFSAPYTEKVVVLPASAIDVVAGSEFKFSLDHSPVKPGSVSILEALVRDMADGKLYNDDSDQVGSIDYRTGEVKVVVAKMSGRSKVTVRYCYDRR